MDASLDTNVIIHLYSAELQEILFRRFEKIKVFDYIRNHEMKRHANADVLSKFDEDVSKGRIEVVTEGYLRSIGMFSVFQSHVTDTRILFNGSDLGEVYAISMAKTLGCICLVTDDIKERGPHYTLMRIPESDVMPFAFYELLFLDYLENIISAQELIDNYSKICSLSSLSMNCESKLNAFLRRFWSKPFSIAEKVWMSDFCSTRAINAKEKIMALHLYLSSINQ